MAMQLPSSSSLSNDFIYDVFISFRGTDTRFSFTGNLYKALSEKGINTFIDDKELPTGDEIKPSLLKSIEDSRIAIIVFSKDYASSSFCLDELVHIIHCSNEKGSIVIPVFYGTEPSHVRKLNDSYGEALAKHEEGFQNNKENLERLLKWKKALNQAANLSGHHFSQGNEYERDFIDKIVTDVSNKVNHVPLHVADYLVGLKSRITEVTSLLDLGSNDGVWIIGIHGTGGIGKTTLAQAVYNLIANQFECMCILHNVRENSVKHGLEYLQEQLLSKSIGLKTQLGHVNEGIPIIKRRLCQKKILLILDDVDKLKQLQVLVGEPGWFGHGSRVIITTRDKHLLSCHGIKKTYEADVLNDEQSLELLRMMAFKSNKNDSGYDHILNHAVKYASGLPLALEVVGSNLFGKSIAECECLLDKYDRIPHEDIQKILKVSFDALDEEQQSVFLDIACCFKGCRLAEIEETLHGRYGHCIKSHLGVLADKSLIKINYVFWCIYKCVTLHDLIEDMGKEIVRQESIQNPGERSRLCYNDDTVHVLQNNKGTNKIEMIYLNCPSMEHTIDNGEAFKKMTALNTLIIKNCQFSESPMCLPSTLKVLIWRIYPLKSLSSGIFSQKLNYMKILTLDNSQYLIHIPDISGLRNLEKFSFQCCPNLITIHNAIGKLNKLEILNAEYCCKLESFPPLQLPSLKELKLSFCVSLKSFPGLLCKMANIKKILISNTSIGELPSSFQNLSELRDLTIYHSGTIRFPKDNDKTNPTVFSKMCTVMLAETNLCDECLPILLKWFVNVKHLDLYNNNFKILPECLSECHHLRKLVLDDCKFLEEIRRFPPNLREFSAIGCVSLSLESRRRLLSKQLHEAGCTEIRFPNGSEGIPDWFEHQIRGDTISFWFRKKIPSITSILIVPESVQRLEFDLFLNGYEYIIRSTIFYYHKVLPSEHAFLFNLELHECINESFENKPELYEAFKNNEGNHVELNWKIHYLSDIKGEVHVSAQMGIHVSSEGYDFSDTEGDVVFLNPYRRRNKFRRMQKKQRAEILQRWGLEETKSDEHNSLEVSETESLQQQDLAFLSSGMHNLVLTETKEEHRFVEMGVSEKETAQRCSLEETKSDEDKSLEVSETETVDVILSIAQMRIQEKSNTEEGVILNNPNSRKAWGTFLSLGASKSNTEGDEIEILNNAQDEREMWGTFLGLAPS